MAGLRRLGAVAFLLLGAWFFAPGAAHAGHCPPIDNPDPVPGQNTTYCHTPKPTPSRSTPEPTVAPTAAPTSARTSAPAPPVVSRTSAPRTTPAPSPFDIEVPDENPRPTIIVDPLDGEADFNVEDGAMAASASSWLFGFIVGLLIGGLIGRASWGLRRRRRQQIFG
jgi:hypothetical protein